MPPISLSSGCTWQSSYICKSYIILADTHKQDVSEQDCDQVTMLV